MPIKKFGMIARGCQALPKRLSEQIPVLKKTTKDSIFGCACKRFDGSL
jgi:hypothetical protein